ncbi:hypothetical protein O6H91_13G099100 [Diphasiastrum complanatum]|uniref:Uncharacterized protein n=1 Tax=Diphasiastrum complanatum TaxID=34168 RepID=A0ACC2BXQ7_DIPCM|nr:hypothetical protein O6H91_13G099100 [Diphasiastrum complanatum]
MNAEGPLIWFQNGIVYLVQKWWRRSNGRMSPGKRWKGLQVSGTGRVNCMSAKAKELNEEEKRYDASNKGSSNFASYSSISIEGKPGKARDYEKSSELDSSDSMSPVLRTNKDEAKSSMDDDQDQGVAGQNGLNGPKFNADEDSAEYVTKIPVSRQKHISVSKMALVRSLLSKFPTKEEASNFLSICTRLESILHAEHRLVLEELRLDYKLTCLSEEEKWLDVTNSDQAKGMCPKEKDADDQVRPQATNGAAFAQHKKSSNSSSVTKEIDPAASSGNTLAARFQQNLMSILETARFQELSARDLQLTTALNSNYLLTLPIDVDWKSASSANVIVFRRGYVTETQNGLLFGEKFDYLQSLLLRKIFSGVAEPLFRAGRWCIQKWKSAEKNQEGKAWTDGIKRWLEEPLYPYLEEEVVTTKQTQGSSLSEHYQNGSDDYDLPIRIAARRAVPRYEAVLSSVGSRGILLKRFLVWIGLLPSDTATFPFLSNGADATPTSEPHLRPNYLSRVSMRDIWLPTSKSICGDNFWKRLKASFSIFFSSSTLQEPAFGELVVLYTKFSHATRKIADDGFPWLQLNIYEKIPIPDLKVIFPNKKLSFRIVDTVRLDFATIVGIIAFLVNYKFVDFLSSPSAFLLDVIASISLLVFASRVIFGYKQTWERYQLLVNKTLYEKTLASGFGVVHFLVDASEEQQATSRQQLKDACKIFVYKTFKEQIEMPMEDVVKNIVRLGLAKLEYKHSKISSANIEDKEAKIVLVPYLESLEALDKNWQDLLTLQTIWNSTITSTY